MSVAVDLGSAECDEFMGVQGYCCPKCFMCGSYEADAAMTNPSAVVQPETGLTCLAMGHLYGFLSYASSSAGVACPTDITTLNTSHIAGSPGVATGFELRGYCGCEGFEDSAPKPPRCSLCPEGKVLTNNDEDLVPNTNITCAVASRIASFVSDAAVCNSTLEIQDTCCMDHNAEEQATPSPSTKALRLSPTTAPQPPVVQPSSTPTYKSSKDPTYYPTGILPPTSSPTSSPTSVIISLQKGSWFESGDDTKMRQYHGHQTRTSPPNDARASNDRIKEDSGTSIRPLLENGGCGRCGSGLIGRSLLTVMATGATAMVTIASLFP